MKGQVRFYWNVLGDVFVLEERVFEHFLDRHALFGIQHENALNEILDFLGYVDILHQGGSTGNV